LRQFVPIRGHPETRFPLISLVEIPPHYKKDTENLEHISKLAIFAASKKETMSQERKNIIEYLVFCIGAFAERYALTNRQAYQYLHQFKGLQFLMDFYDVEHTQSIEDAVDDCTNICKRHGGALSL